MPLCRNRRAPFHLNGLAFHYDANSGQKTGAFLDQRTNYAAAREWARDGWAATAARSMSAATRAALRCIWPRSAAGSPASTPRAPRWRWPNATLKPIAAAHPAEVDWVEADAFQILRDWSDAGERFDAIVLDPPAFAKSKRAVEGALRGYKELNLRALKMLAPGGLLVTCSCSHHVGWAELEAVVASAAADASRRVRLLERRGAAPDHPVVLNLPETEYLKCLVLEARVVQACARR